MHFLGCIGRRCWDVSGAFPGMYRAHILGCIGRISWDVSGAHPIVTL